MLLMKTLIKECDYENIKPLIKLGKKERVTFENPEGCVWFSAEFDGKVIGCCALVFKGSKVRFKSNFVHPNYRMNGVGKAMLAARMKRLDGFIGKATVFSTPISWPSYDIYDFVEYKKNKYGIVYGGRIFK
jgi:N-acetylglutamate synthase-like GNAT family acetyltransferase